MREKLNRFMQGRYGMDPFGRTILIFSLVMVILSMAFTRWWIVSMLLDALGLGGLIVCYYRIFSRNYAARAGENRRFLAFTEGIRRRIGKEKYLFSQRKEYHIYSCPECKQKIRIPRGDGKKVEIDCPKCHAKFIKRR